MSLFDGPSDSIEEASSKELLSKMEQGEERHFLLGRVMERGGGLNELSEDVGLGGGLPGGVPMEKLRCGTVRLEQGEVAD